MSTMHCQALFAYGQPLRQRVLETPVPRGSEVLVRVERCGVCHSDLHLQDGYFELGGERRLDISKDRPLPFTLGHEIAVYPWIGCGSCAACRAGEENLCAAHRHLGIAVDGGFATHVLVPHPRYLLDYAPLAAELAAPLMCSGLTAYAALGRLGRRTARGPVLLIGLGGVGMMGLSLARALLSEPPIVADIDPRKREAALAAGAAAAYDPADPQARRAVLAATGGLAAVCDFVGSDKSLQFACGVVARGGKIVVTGLFGGTFSIAAAMLAIKAMTLEGTLTGTLAQAHALIALARAGKIAPIPTRGRPLAEAQAALEDLRAGRVVGRTILYA